MMTQLCCRQWPARCRSLYASSWLIAVIASVHQTYFFCSYTTCVTQAVTLQHRLPCKLSESDSNQSDLNTLYTWQQLDCPLTNIWQYPVAHANLLQLHSAAQQTLISIGIINNLIIASIFLPPPRFVEVASQRNVDSLHAGSAHVRTHYAAVSRLHA